MSAFIGTLSHWANRHTRLAILLIVLGEIINGFNAVLLGASLLDNLPVVGLQIVMIGVVISLIWLYRTTARQTVSRKYWEIRRCLFMTFLGNFLLFGLLGGIWSHRVQTSYPSASVLGSYRSVAVRDTIPPTSSLQRQSQPKTITKKPSDSTGGQRFAYVLLGLLGIGVTFLLTGLACNILCSGYGFGALLVFYLGLGGIAGTAYFFSRALDNPFRLRRDMTQPERRRDSRRFWLAWLFLIFISSILLLVGSR